MAPPPPVFSAGTKLDHALIATIDVTWSFTMVLGSSVYSYRENHHNLIV